jgi:hypothetical protein
MLLEFFISELVGDQLSIHPPTALTLRKESYYPLDGRKFRPEVWSRHGGINSLYLPGRRVIEIAA